MLYIKRSVISWQAFFVLFVNNDYVCRGLFVEYLVDHICYNYTKLMDGNLNLTWNANQDFLDVYTELVKQIDAGNHCYNYKIKELRSKVFQHTVAIVKQGYYLVDFDRKVYLDEQNKMVDNTQFYCDEFRVDEILSAANCQTEVSVVKEDYLAEGIRLKAEGYNPAVVNMASLYTPGGGAYSGAGAQEETIFRRTNICLSLYQFAEFANVYGLKKSQFQYPLDANYGGIYTPNAVVFRGGLQSGFSLMDTPVTMSFISVAPISRPELTSDGMLAESLVEQVKNKIRTILRIGLKHQHDALVMEAFGCSSFRNPPKHIARLFHEILNETEFKNKFRHISFAITEDHNSFRKHNPEGNFKPFFEEFCRA